MKRSLFAATLVGATACSAADDLGVVPERADATGPASARAAPSVEAARSAPSTHGGPTGSPARSAPPPAAGSPLANDRSQHPILRAIAARHDSFSRADGTWWSLLGCLAPPPESARFSDAPADAAHGRKLYTLKIADFDAYAKEVAIPPAQGRTSPAGPAVAVPGAAQAVVKVSYAPTRDARAAHAPLIAPVTKDGEKFYAGAAQDLFVMYRPTDASVATDAGWLYGTVAPSGEVTSAGRVSTCMACHADAPHGRLFGPRASD